MKHFNILVIFLLLVVSTSFFSCENVLPKNYQALISTSAGDIRIKLYDETPQHRDNFVKLIESGFYDGLLFHRVIQDFMVQTGDPDSRNAKADAVLGNGGTDYTIPAEFSGKLFHKKGVLSAARLGDAENPNQESSGSQFFIVTGKKYDAKALETLAKKKGLNLTEEQKQAYQTIGGTPHLDGNYSVFGEITAGLDVLEKIAAAKKGNNNRPIEDISIKNIKIITE
ncbi:MAG: peptidylprolyl isomerase [Chitinophagales bacterium]